MPALKGVHLAVKSGILAAETVAKAIVAEDFSEKTLAGYEKMVMASNIYRELYPVRNFRQAFSKGLIGGGLKFASQLITGGAGFCGMLKAHEDKEATMTIAGFKNKPFRRRFAGKLDFDKVLTFDKVTDIYYSGVAHDEHQVSHLHVNNPETFKSVNIAQYGAPCQYFCPAEVYEVHADKSGNRELRIHFENCVHCKTCDIKSVGDGITWNVPYGGNGPDYQNM
jgi:electron-transferring-flavoprotein dehydrogenase